MSVSAHNCHHAPTDPSLLDENSRLLAASSPVSVPDFKFLVEQNKVDATTVALLLPLLNRSDSISWWLKPKPKHLPWYRMYQK